MQAIRGIYAVCRREVVAIKGDRLYIAIVLILPIVLITFFVVMFWDGEITKLPISVVDNDNSAMSRRLISMIDATSGVDIESVAHSLLEANDSLLKGEVYGYIVIPDGFGESVVGSRSTSVNAYISATNLSAAGILKRDIQQAAMAFSSGVTMTRLALMGVEGYKVMAEVMPVNIHLHTVANPYMNYGYYLAPIFMIVGVIIFTVLSTIYAIGRELRYATAPQWISAAYGSLPVAIVGKLLPTTVAMMVMLQLVMFILFVVMGMECMGSYMVLLLTSLLFIISYQAVAIAFVAITANLRMALSLGGGYSVMAFTFSGITFPIIAMYGVAQLFSKLFPLTYFCQVFINEAMLGIDVRYSLDDIGALLIFMLLVPLVWRRLGRVVHDNRYWGRD